MSPIPWVVSPKYSTPIQLSATSETDMFTAFTSSQELIVFKVVGSQANSPKKIFRILARKGSSSYPTYRVDEAFSAALDDSKIGVLQLSQDGWLRFKAKFHGDLTISQSLDTVQTEPTIRPAIVNPHPATAPHPSTDHLLFHASTETQGAQSGLTVIYADFGTFDYLR